MRAGRGASGVVRGRGAGRAGGADGGHVGGGAVRRRGGDVVVGCDGGARSRGAVGRAGAGGRGAVRVRDAGGVWAVCVRLREHHGVLLREGAGGLRPAGPARRDPRGGAGGDAPGHRARGGGLRGRRVPEARGGRHGLRGGGGAHRGAPGAAAAGERHLAAHRVAGADGRAAGGGDVRRVLRRCGRRGRAVCRHRRARPGARATRGCRCGRAAVGACAGRASGCGRGVAHPACVGSAVRRSELRGVGSGAAGGAASCGRRRDGRVAADAGGPARGRRDPRAVPHDVRAVADRALRVHPHPGHGDGGPPAPPRPPSADAHIRRELPPAAHGPAGRRARPARLAHRVLPPRAVRGARGARIGAAAELHGGGVRGVRPVAADCCGGAVENVSGPYDPTPVTLLVSSPPVFAVPAGKAHHDVSFAEGRDGVDVEIYGRALGTPGKGAGEGPMLHPFLAGGACEAAAAGDARVVLLPPLRGITPVSASIEIATGGAFAGNFRVCVAVALATPKAAGDWFTAIDSNVSVSIGARPSFDPPADTTVPYSARLMRAAIAFTGGGFTPEQLWLAVPPAGMTCGDVAARIGRRETPSGMPWVMRLPYTNATAFELTAEFVLQHVADGAAAGAGDTDGIDLCWCATTAAVPDGAAPSGCAWEATGVALSATPAPLIHARTDPAELLLSARHGAAGGARITLHGEHIEEGIVWALLAPEVAGDGTPCAPLPLACAHAGPSPTRVCATAGVVLPPLAANASYAVRWAVAAAPPATLPATAAATGVAVRVAAATAFAAARHEVSLAQYVAGAELVLAGVSVGGRLWVWFDALDVGVDGTVCALTASRATAGGEWSIPAALLPQQPVDASAATLRVAANSSLVQPGGEYRVCYADAEAVDGALAAAAADGEGTVRAELRGTPTAITVSVAAAPEFDAAVWTPSLADVLDEAGRYRVAVAGQHLDQEGLWGAWCLDAAACAADASALFPITDEQIPGPQLPEGNVTANATTTAALFWTAAAPADDLNAAAQRLRPTGVRVVMPAVPAFRDSLVVNSLLQRAVPLRGATAPWDPAHAYACLCDGAWVAVTPADGGASFTPRGMPAPDTPHRVCVTFAHAPPTTAARSLPTRIAVRWAGAPHVDSAVPARASLVDIMAGEVPVAFVGRNLQPEVWVAHVPAHADCGSAALHHANGSRLSGTDTAATYVLDVDPADYASAYRLCWGVEDRSATAAAVRVNWTVGGDLGISIAMAPRPEFDPATVELPASAVLSTTRETALVLAGAGLSDDVYVTLHAVDAAGAGGDDAATPCDASPALARARVAVDPTAARGVARLLPPQMRALAAVDAAGLPVARVFALCWFAVGDEGAGAEVELLPTPVRITVNPFPRISASAPEVTVRDLLAGGTVVVATGTHIANDTVAYLNCDPAHPAHVNPLERAANGTTTAGITLPAAPAAWLAPQQPPHLPLCAAVGGPRGANLTALVRVAGFSITPVGLPAFERLPGTAHAGGVYVVEGANLAPNAASPGALLALQPEGEGCGGAGSSESLAVAASDRVELPVPAVPRGTVLQLCAGLAPAAMRAVQGGRIFVELRPASQAPATPLPTPVPLVPTAQPPTAAPATPLPVAATAVPCPPAAEVGVRLRDECYFGAAGLVGCLRPRANPAGARSLTACKGSYSACTARILTPHDACFPQAWWESYNGTFPLHTVALPMPKADFDQVLFVAAVSAMLTLPPQYVLVTSIQGREGAAPRREAAPQATSAAAAEPSTLVTFLVNGDHVVQSAVIGFFPADAGTAAGSDAFFPVLGEEWAGVTIVNKTAPPNVAAGGGVDFTIVAIIIGAMLLVFVGPGTGILCCTIYRKRRRAQRGDDQAKAQQQRGRDVEAGNARLQCSTASFTGSMGSDPDTNLQSADPAASAAVASTPPVVFGAPAPCAEASDVEACANPAAAGPGAAAVLEEPTETTPVATQTKEVKTVLASRTPLGQRSVNVPRGVVDSGKGEKKTPAGAHRGCDGDMEAMSVTPCTTQVEDSYDETPLQRQAVGHDPFSLTRSHTSLRSAQIDSIDRPQTRLQFDTPQHPLHRHTPQHPRPGASPAPSNSPAAARPTWQAQARRAHPSWVATPPQPHSAADAAPGPSPSPVANTAQRARDWMVSNTDGRQVAPTPSFCHKCGEEWQGGRFCGFCGVLALGVGADPRA